MENAAQGGATIRIQSAVLWGAAAACFADAVFASGAYDPGRVVVGVMGILLVRRAVVRVPQPHVVIASGCLLAAFMIVSNLGWINGNEPGWIVFMVLGFVCYALWERIEGLWKRLRSNQER